MEDLPRVLLEDLSRNAIWYLTFSILIFFSGISLLTAGLFPGLLKITRSEAIVSSMFELAPGAKISLRTRISLAIAGLALVVPGALGIHAFGLTPTLRVLTNLTQEEFEKFQEITTLFENTQKGKKEPVRVYVENLGPKDLLTKLSEERIDLVVFDITYRHELERQDLIEELSEEYERLIPSSVYPTLPAHMKLHGKTYFLPYRPNVRIVWLNKRKFGKLDRIKEFECNDFKISEKASDEEIKRKLPKTWHDVLRVAKCFDRFEEQTLGVAQGSRANEQARVIISAKNIDASLLLLELIRSAGGKPYDVCGGLDRRVTLPKNSKSSGDAPETLLELLRELWHYVGNKSSEINWQTATGHLLTDSVYLARNWSFSIKIMGKAGALTHFYPYAGWHWGGNGLTKGNFVPILGGDVLALPKNARHKDEAKALMAFLLSYRAQQILVSDLFWPPMRLDTRPETSADMKAAVQAVEQTMRYAEPTPDYWSSEMEKTYKNVFQKVVKAPHLSDELIKNAAGIYCEEADSKIPLKLEIMLARRRIVYDGWSSAKLRIELRNQENQAASYPHELEVQILPSNAKESETNLAEWSIPAGHTWIEKTVELPSWPLFPTLRVKSDQIAHGSDPVTIVRLPPTIALLAFGGLLGLFLVTGHTLLQCWLKQISLRIRTKLKSMDRQQRIKLALYGLITLSLAVLPVFFLATTEPLIIDPSIGSISASVGVGFVAGVILSWFGRRLYKRRESEFRRTKLRQPE